MWSTQIGSGLGKGNLFRGFQVGDEIADVVAREILQQALGHHGDGRGFAGEDRGFGDDRVLADEAEGEFLIVFGDDVAGAWTLTVSDPWPIDSGELRSWALIFELASAQRSIRRRP